MNKLIGYHDNLPIKRGDKVRIRKGTMLRSTSPRAYRTSKNGAFEAKTSYVVKVDHTLSGRTNFDGKPIENPKVRWAGAGGYWIEADINDVEVVVTPENDKCPTGYHMGAYENKDCNCVSREGR